MAGGGRRRPGRGRTPTWRFLFERSRECLGGGRHHGRIVVVAHICGMSVIAIVVVVVIVGAIGEGGSRAGGSAVAVGTMSIVGSCS